MKSMFLFKTLAIAGSVLLGSAIGALAVEAQATTDLNVRTGPATSYGVLDTLRPGEVVNIRECTSSNWCYIEQDGPNGWVSARFLAAVPEPTPPAPSGGATPSGSRDCQLRLTLGSGRPTMELVCNTPAGGSGSGSGSGSGGTPPPPPPPPPADRACFYRDADFQGPSFCSAPDTLDTLQPRFDNKISSVKLFGNATAKLCVDTNMNGYCARVINDAPTLGVLLDDRVSSLRVTVPGVPGTPTPGTPPPPAVTYKTGPFVIVPNEHVDLDTGTKNGAGTDIWYRNDAGLPKRLQPIRGAKMALGDGTNRSFAACSAETYSTDYIEVADIPVGTYICVKTNQGRYAVFRMNAKNSGELRIGFTTWAN
ncbi:MAG TPA: hypothetical protein ENK41_04195 [Rhodobacteraceae bacterium]|nr:hypothetical protein [Paracoccaceae bacterium]